jgi:Myosin N-terminal SH3-like domain
MAATVHTLGSLVWVVDATVGWVKGEVTKVLPKNQLQVKLEDGRSGTFEAADCPLQNPVSRGGVEVRHLT